MSSLFKQISAEAAQQRQQVDEVDHSPTPPGENKNGEKAVSPRKEPSGSTSESSKLKKVAPQSGTTAPHSGTMTPHIDTDKLQIIIRELSQLPTNSNGINVRISEQELQDIEEFIHGTLRQRGVKGYNVSITKLMRYAFRYLARVHEQEFIDALEDALKVEETLSI